MCVYIDFCLAFSLVVSDLFQIYVFLGFFFRLTWGEGWGGGGIQSVTNDKLVRAKTANVCRFVKILQVY